MTTVYAKVAAALAATAEFVTSELERTGRVQRDDEITPEAEARFDAALRRAGYYHTDAVATNGCRATVARRP